MAARPSQRLRQARASGRWPRVPVGANIGKSKVTPLADAHEDYLQSVERLKPYADYFTVNVGSPNTPGLRNFSSLMRSRPFSGSWFLPAAIYPCS